MNPITSFGSGGLKTLGGVGSAGIFLVHAISQIFARPFRFRRYLQEIEFLGAKSFFIVFVTALFTGMVLALQGYYTLSKFGAIVMDPKVVFYDEPTSGLDPIAAGVIDKLIRDLNLKLGVTSIVVSHDVDAALKIADKIIILFYGDIIAEGTPDEIRNSEDPKVIQFINGSPDGPIPFKMTDKDFIKDILDEKI